MRIKHKIFYCYDKDMGNASYLIAENILEACKLFKAVNGYPPENIKNMCCDGESVYFTGVLPESKELKDE
jgi:hypothetical protein